MSANQGDNYPGMSSSAGSGEESSDESGPTPSLTKVKVGTLTWTANRAPPMMQPTVVNQARTSSRAESNHETGAESEQSCESSTGYSPGRTDFLHTLPGHSYWWYG